jgi:hypothetical protein
LGCAIGTLIPAVVVQGFVQPVIIHRFVGVSAVQYMFGVISRPVGGGALAYGIGAGVRNLATCDNWFQFWTLMAGSSFAAACVAVLVGVSAHDRSRFIDQPMNRFASRIGLNRACPEASSCPSVPASAAREAGDRLT